MEQESNQEHQKLGPEIYRQQQEVTTNQKLEQIQEQGLNQEPSQKSKKELSQTPIENTTNKMELIREQDEIENVQESHLLLQLSAQKQENFLSQ